MSDTTFDATRNYKRICYKEDRDLLNTELNEMQDLSAFERVMITDRILAQGTILDGLSGAAAAGNVTVDDGVVYLDGCAVVVPGAVLSFTGSGEHTIYLAVFRRDVTASEDPALVNPLTGEPTAEREKWVATLQARDTSGDPLPTGAKSRSVVPVLIFNRDTGEIRPTAGVSGDGGSIISEFANHVGHGGLDRHPAATSELAGFMPPEFVGEIDNHDHRLQAIEIAIPSKADSADVTAVSNALAIHKTSGDHDGRYYTETESDGRFAPVGHVGAGGAAHAAATTGTAGFLSAADKTKIGDHETRIASVESTLPGKANTTDVTAVTNALNTHKGSTDHDSRYYTEGESDGRFAAIAHVGAGGAAHAAATGSAAGFLSSADKTKLDGHETRLATVETTLPNKANTTDVTTVSNALGTHKTSADHDSRYFTESESDARFAAIAHVGAAGGAHALATVAQPGFFPKEMFECLSGLLRWTGWYDYGNDSAGAMAYGMISGREGLVWKGRSDSSSSHTIIATLRSVGTPITAQFEFYHMVGTVTMTTGDRVRLNGGYSPPVPGGKAYDVDLYPDSFTSVTIKVSGSGDVGFGLHIFPGDDRQMSWEMDPARAGKAIYV